MSHRSVGSTLESFLEEEGLHQEATELAAKKILALQLEAVFVKELRAAIS